MTLKTLSIHRDTQIPGTFMAATRVTKYMTFKWHRMALLPTNKSNNTYVNNSSKIFKAKMQALLLHNTAQLILRDFSKRIEMPLYVYIKIVSQINTFSDLKFSVKVVVSKKFGYRNVRKAV